MAQDVVFHGVCSLNLLEKNVYSTVVGQEVFCKVNQILLVVVEFYVLDDFLFSCISCLGEEYESLYLAVYLSGQLSFQYCAFCFKLLCNYI